MPRITFQPMGRAIDAATGTSLMDTARSAGIELESECGGRGTCGSCMLLVESGEVLGDSRSFLPFPAIEEGYVLACRSQVGHTDLSLRLAGVKTIREGAQFADAAQAESHTHKPRTSCQDGDLPVHRTRVTVPRAQPEDGLSDLDRLESALLPLTKAQALGTPLPVLRTVAQALRQNGGDVTCTWSDSGTTIRLLDIASGPPVIPFLGAAVDLGTTSISVQILDLDSGVTLGSATAYNPQTSRGLDVISRINHAQKPGGLEELGELALTGINSLLERACNEAGQACEEIMAVSLAGNTVMTHLLLGLEPEYIRLAPYTPTVHRPQPYDAGDLGLAVHPLAPVLLAPSVGSYVGGDIVAGLLCTSLSENTGQGTLRLFLDIGTNGEVVVGDGDFLLGCACSAGPAFEGGGLSCGLCAATGAVERATVDAETGAPVLRVMGKGPVAGICGSGAIDLLASLFRTGWLDAAGKLDRERPCEHIHVEGRRASYILARAEESATGREVALTEADIDNLLRAKAAIYAGCAMLLEQAGIDFADLDEVIVAGGFGRFLDMEAAVTIGLLPDLPRERFRFIGNASLAGATQTLRSRTLLARQDALADRLTYMELSTEPAYMDHYTAALFLPHTDASRFPSVHKGGR